MRIEDLRSETTPYCARVAATVIWEECDREPEELYYQTVPEFANDLTCDPHAFPLGALLPAVQCGEQRILIDGATCPEFRNGLRAVIAWFREWYGMRDAISIEAGDSVRHSSPRPPRAGSFLSGGVDSLSVLRANRRDFPLDHPASIKDCLFVHGFDIGALPGCDPELGLYDLACRALSTIAQDAGITLIPVWTNVRHLFPDVHFWVYQFHGAALASVAHAFSRRLSCVSIASSFSIRDIARVASHPLIDPNFGSCCLRIRHKGGLYTRFEKVQLIADWRTALENLRVCTHNPTDRLNCGVCEKCVRTMLQLLALDRLDQTTAFGTHQVYPEMIQGIRLHHQYEDAYYAELLEPLTALGRLDLVEAIQHLRRDFAKRCAWEEERDWKGAVKRFDRRWLGSALYKTYSTARAARGPHAASDA